MFTPWGIHKHIKGAHELCLTFLTNWPNIVQTFPAQIKCMISNDYPHSTTTPPKNPALLQNFNHSSLLFLSLTFHINLLTLYLSSTFKIYLESDHFLLSRTTLVQDTILPHLGLLQQPPTCSCYFHSYPLSYSTFSIQQPQWSFQCFPYHFTPLQRFLISEEKTKFFKWLKRPYTSGSRYLLPLNIILLSCKTLQSHGSFSSFVNTPNPLPPSGLCNCSSLC